jgi:hypothetical protein
MSKTKKKKKLKSFLVDAGNSSKGPVGFCMRVKAYTKEEAIEIAKQVMPEAIEVDRGYLWDEGDNLVDRVEYLNVYFNDQALTVADIEESETEDAEEDEDND